MFHFTLQTLLDISSRCVTDSIENVVAVFNIHSQTTDKGRQTKINTMVAGMNDTFDQQVITDVQRILNLVDVYKSMKKKIQKVDTPISWVSMDYFF